MEANNLFNFGSHPSESANSGLKLSSGDALYANGSTMSFPQQGKNLNGDKNVNGITTVIGTSPPGSRPSTSYSHMSNHHHQESGTDYDYLWGQPQYSPGMSVGAGTGVHRKQDPGGLMPQQTQQHFQGHGQYPLNGALTGSQPPSVAAPTNVTVTGGQYWSRESPTQQQSSSSMDMGYNSHGTYGTRTYQNQVRLDMTVQQQQQQQRFGVVPNGSPFYQHQQSQNPPLPVPQAPIMPPTAQSFVSPRSSPQHHHMSPRSTSSPLPIKVPSVAVPVAPPASVPEKGAPQAQDNSLCSPRVLSAVMQGCFNETFKEVGNGYNEIQTSVAQSLPKTAALDSKAPMVPPNDSCLGVQHAASDVGHPINKHEVGLKVKDSNPLVASASSESHEPELRVFAKETDTGAILKPELAVLRSEAGAIDLPETDSKIGCHLEEKADQSPVNSPVASRGDTASGNQASERMSPFVEPPVAGPGALERTGAPLSGCPLNDACGMDEAKNDPFLMESSYTDNSRAATMSHADDTFNGTLDSFCRDSQFTDESMAVGDSTEGLSQLNESQNEDPWKKDEMADSSLTTEDSFRGALLDDTSQLEHSMNNGSRSATSPLSSTSDNLESMNNFSTDSKMEEDQHGQDAPDSAVGTARLTFEDRRVAPVRGASKQFLQDKALSSLLPATIPVDLNTGKPVGKKRRVAAPIHDPQNSRLSQSKSTAEEGQGAAKGQNGGGEEEMVGPEKSTEDLPVVFEVPIRSNPKPRPPRCPNPLPIKPKKAKRAKKLTAKVPKVAKVEAVMEDLDEEDDAANGIQRRRIATEEEVNFPLLHGWRREIRVRRSEDRLKGETWYYSPCGRRMKQFPEVIKYLKRHQGSVVSREHFSFSPRMPVGDFYEERESPEGLKWFPLANEEVPSMIMAITGRRGRPPNPDKEKPRSRVRRIQGGATRRPGRPPKPNMIDLLSKVDARLLEKLEAQETLSAEEKEKLTKIKRKMKRKARNISKADAKNKNIIEEKRKVKPAKAKEMKEKEAPGGVPDQASHQPLPEPKKPGRRKRVKAEEKVEEKSTLAGMRGGGARSKAKALAKAQAEAEAQAQAAAASRRQAERRAQAQRRQEERRRQQMILEELKKPTEDMCLTDHQPLPELSRVPGLVLSGQAFSHCLMVVEFLHSYGKVLGLEVPQDVPSLSALQEGLLGLGGRQSEIQDLLVKLVQAALRDPGLPSHYQSVKILGEKLVELELNRSSVSEGLRVFLESHGFEPEVCRSLRSKPFQAHSPDTKASILAFVVDELNGSSIVIRDIDSTLENMAIYRKNKWTIEGKLRKLKTALARRTGRSEADLCLEERRRSARVAEEERLSLEDSGLLERGGRRARREEAKLSEGESPTTASIPELERQIDKLTKRQVFFRKKLLQSSHSLRAVSLGQDRYRRRYWVLPRIGGILVEGPEEILASDDVLVREDAVPLTAPVKKEPKLELPPTPIAAASPPPNLSSPEVDPLPGTASLMSSPRGRGRPRKIKPEVELHLRTAKCRRRRRSSKASGDEAVEVGMAERGMQDLTQSAFLSWLSQTQGSVVNGAASAEASAGDCAQQDSMKEMAEKQGQWFNLLPKTPCDPTSPSADTPQSPRMPPELSASLSQSGRSFSDSAVSPQVCSTPLLKLGKRGRRTSNSVQPPGDPCTLGFTIPSATKRRGRPPSKLLQQIEQKYFTQLMAKPIPAAMVRGWWWIREPEELTALLQGLHPRGIREKALHKHLAKHMEFLTEICTRPCSDPIFQKAVEDGGAVSQVLQQPWNECTRAMDSDLNVLQWVEDLEQRVLAADLQIKMASQSGRSGTDSSVEKEAPGYQGFTLPEPDSTREDLQYHEHDVDLLDDWLVKTKKEWSDHLRLMTNPLDLAVLRLANLERNIERTYLKEPLWSLGEVVRLAPLEPLPGEENRQDVESLESEITPRLRAWRQALDRVCSAAQLSLCLLQLERAIAWERSVVKVTCLVCRKGDNDEYLLLCDGCDRGCHMFCLRPKVTQVPEGDWFCPVCTSKENGESPRLRRFPKQKKVRKRYAGGYDSESSDEEDGYRRRGGMTTRRRDGLAVSSHARFSGECGGSSSSPCKRRRMVTRNQPDLTYCEIILMEMESHTDAWPFLEPVNPRLVPGYRRIIKNPMDFLTMRERLLQGGYCSCEEFAADAQLVFNNCQLFNEDTSEVGLAGLSMRRFFESRWAEFYQNKDQ